MSSPIKIKMKRLGLIRMIESLSKRLKKLIRKIKQVKNLRQNNW